MTAPEFQTAKTLLMNRVFNGYYSLGGSWELLMDEAAACETPEQLAAVEARCRELDALGATRILSNDELAGMGCL